ncbi:MAG TPA: S41 family peptidase [Candidatus Saccharibacteria bacterium]|nr:S41 family peptidase [Candidatus Saccharibacteria bacterium]
MSKNSTKYIDNRVDISPISYFITLFAIALIFFALGNRVKYMPLPGILKSESAQNLSGQVDTTGLQKVYDTLKSKYDGDLTDEEVNLGLKRGLVQSIGDPHTSYFTKDEYQQFSSDLQGRYSGIGAEVGKKGDAIEIISPLDDSPAAKAGLRPGDIIMKVGDYSVGQESTLQEVVDKIKGDAGTVVNIKIFRQSEGERDYQIVRENIKDKSVKFSVDDGILNIRVSRFADDTANLVTSAIETGSKDKNLKGVIVDLRDNGGGQLDAAVSVSSQWLNFGQTVVEERAGGKVRQTFKSDRNGPLAGLKTAVLVNSYSASASEIVTGALRDYKKARIIGQKTYGKGSVQELIPLDDGSALKVTVAKWFTPNGDNIDKQGIEPDQEVKMDYAQKISGDDLQKQAAIQYINNN